MPIPVIYQIKEGFKRFVIIFRWQHNEDLTALERLRELKFPKGLEAGGFYLTGERTAIFIGQTNSELALQQFSSSVTFGNAIEGRAYWAVDIAEMDQLYKDIKM